MCGLGHLLLLMIALPCLAQALEHSISLGRIYGMKEEMSEISFILKSILEVIISFFPFSITFMKISFNL